MYALKFDDLKRRLHGEGIVLNKLSTCYEGTPEFERWFGLLDLPEQPETFQFVTEDDGKTHTFFTVRQTNNND